MLGLPLCYFGLGLSIPRKTFFFYIGHDMRSCFRCIGDRGGSQDFEKEVHGTVLSGSLKPTSMHVGAWGSAPGTK